MDDDFAILRLRTDKRVNKFLDRPVTATIEAAHQFISKIENSVANNESVYWAITLKDIDRLIGTICIWNIEATKEQAEIGFELYPDFQGKGLMQEALAKVIEFGFTSMKLSVITGLTKPENNSSVKLLLKNYFQLDKENKYVSKEEAGGLAVYFLLPAR